jgi:cystathionine gamma-synthase
MKKGLSTNLIHLENVEHESGSVMAPIVLSTTFERQEDQLSFNDNFIYSRYDNPNRRSLESKLAFIENGKAAISFSSGLSAAMAVFHSIGSGSHIIIPNDIYFGIKKIIQQLYPHWDLTYTEVDMTDSASVEKVIQKNTKLIWMETPSNPSVKISDISAINTLAKKFNLITVVDNTWATPYHTQPLDMGVDIVMHSTTKYIGGHSDILGGSLIFKEENHTYEFIRQYQKIGGAVPSPFDCWLLCRSLSTFKARMKIHSDNAMGLANYLYSHKHIEKVFYPGLPDDLGHDTARKQMKNGFGGMLSILVKGGMEEALKVCKHLQIFKHATSLGGVESLIEHRKSVEGDLSTTPHNLLRISVGIEEIEDLVLDFDNALKHLD